ncbi:hypothetical protein [Hymenobacter nivis]|uniref:hypothetical protein n=1 Tax=Hymenobacter nivis TaxID=1850093 RepID=UPI0013A56961|nr:hypothetical protein [Hymenobacter nivis]
MSDFYHWQNQLAALYTDFYAAVWLFEPRFGYSQLVAAIGERKDHYEQLFESEAGFQASSSQELPPEYQALAGVQGLQWTKYPEVELLLPDDFAEQSTWVKKKHHWPSETQHEAPYIAVQVGWVWVGRLKNDTFPASANSSLL